MPSWLPSDFLEYYRPILECIDTGPLTFWDNQSQLRFLFCFFCSHFWPNRVRHKPNRTHGNIVVLWKPFKHTFTMVYMCLVVDHFVPGEISEWKDHISEETHAQFMGFYREKMKDVPDLLDRIQFEWFPSEIDTFSCTPVVLPFTETRDF